MTDLLTTKELQAILHVDRTTIYRMAESGRLPAVKVGDQWRFPRQQIDGWLRQTHGLTCARSRRRKRCSTAPRPRSSRWSACN